MPRETIVICRHAADPLKPGYVLGYSCASCGQALQVGPSGKARLDAGGKPLCNDCGFALEGKLIATGHPHQLQLSPEAQRQIDELVKKKEKDGSRRRTN